MSKSFAEIARHPARFGAILALGVAVAVLALLIARMDTGAVHNEGLLEMDGNVAYDGGDGFAPGTGRCGFPYPTAGPSPVDCIIDPAPTGSPTVDSPGAAFDWETDVCVRDESGGALDGYITEATTSLAPELASADVICQADFIQGATDDISYHTGSDKDYQEITSDPPGAGDTWHCLDSSNATSKADILNAYAISIRADESSDSHQLVYFGAERDSENGSVYNGYWILQDDITVPPSAQTDGQLDCTSSGLPTPCTTTTAPCNFSGQHVCGDVLVRFNYTSGGRVGGVLANEWVAPTPGVTYTPAFNAANGCDQLAGGGAACPGGSPGTAPDCDDDGVNDAADNCTAAQQASAESHSVPGGFLCTRPPAQGDCRAVLDQTAPGDNLCGRVNGEQSCTIAPKQNDPNPPPCSGPGCFETLWEPGDSDPGCPPPGHTGGVPSPTFSEMGIDLTGLNLELPCIAALVVESRSSPSIDATLKDFVLMPTGAVCESSIRTEIHNVANHGDTDSDIQGTTVYRGTVIHDAALVSPTGNGPNAFGTVTFTLFDNATCDGNVIGTPEQVDIIDQIPAGIPSGDTGQIDSGTFDTDTTTATAISYTASVDLDDPYSDSTLPDEDCEPLTIINPSTTLDKELAFSVTVTYTYTETNDGDDPLSSPSVSDPVCVANGGTVEDVDVSPADGINDGDTNLNPGDTVGVLDPDESFLFKCTVTLTEADLDSFPVTNTAVGHGTDSNGKDVTICTAGEGTPTPAPGPNNGQFCDPDETDSTSIDITVDQGK